MDTSALKLHYDEIRAEATRLAGDLLDIPRRVVVLYNLYLDSGRNHAFSQIAAHGALWAHGYFEVGGRLGRFVARRYFYNSAERTYRLGLLNQFATDFRTVNRQVCIDTVTNYHFTRKYGQLSGAADFVPAGLLDALNRIHAARRGGRELPPDEKRNVFEQSFHCEQEVTVAPGVHTAVAGFECRIMKGLCLRPFVRFAYFPRCRYLWFNDFSNKEERIEKGMRAFDFAERMGWAHVSDSMRAYRVLPGRVFDGPKLCFAEIQAGVASA